MLRARQGGGRAVFPAVLVILSAATGALAADAAADAPTAPPDAPAAPDRLPPNQWVRLETRGDPGYVYSRPVWVPERGQVLQWGVVERGESRPYFRNDVRAFDGARLRWTSDYPKAADLPSTVGPPYGKGIWYSGSGEMLSCGTPAPSAVCDAVAWDPKRRWLVFTMKGLMAAYDPASRAWRDLKAETDLEGRRLPGGPPVYGAGTAYDPAGDELVLFPHWGGENSDLRDVTGRLSAHWGTFLYSFADNRWRRAGPALGDAETRASRQRVIDLMGRWSRHLDEMWRLRRRPDKARHDALARALAAEPDGAGTAALLAAGDLAGALARGSGVLGDLERRLETRLRIEPPPRCGTPLVYHPKARAIVMFGGHDGLVRTDLEQPEGHGGPPGALNDTWLYDGAARRWRELPCPRRPPPTLWPKMAYDPASGLVLLVTRTGRWEKKERQRVTLWALDLEKGEWTRRHEQPWPWPHGDGHATGWAPDPFEVALDEKHGVLLLTQNVRGEGGGGQEPPAGETYAMRLDLGALAAEPAPAWTEPPPVRPIEIPPDDAAWLAHLKALPANTWTAARPPREAPDRGWGVVACDQGRGWLVYFGGGHATYQVNNVDVYVVGANRWVTTAGDHNDYVPPVSWGGTAMGMRGGRHAHHQRNEYAALDGRMYWSPGTESRRWGAETAKAPGPRYAWFFDIDRGGVWRQERLPQAVRGEGVPGFWGRAHLADPAGHVWGFGGALEPYDGRFFEGEAYFAALDVCAGALAVRAVPAPRPGIVMECRPFCVVPERGAIFFYECLERDGRVERRGTWLYHVAENRFEDLGPRRHPPGEPGTVEYLAGQDAVWAAVGRNEQWVYSFARNAWAPMALKAEDERFSFDPVYTQAAYVAKHGVLVGVGAASRGTTVMRPDVSGVRWDE